MSLFQKSIKQKAEGIRQRRMGTQRQEPLLRAVDRATVINGFLYLAFGVLAVFVCFFGLSPAGPQLQTGHVSRVRITADIDFSYTSRIETARLQESLRQRVPPVFRLERAGFESFRAYMVEFYNALVGFADVPGNLPEEIARLQSAEVERFFGDYPPGNPYRLRAADVAVFYNQLGAERGNLVLGEGLILLGEIFRRGIYPADAVFGLQEGHRLTLFTIEDESGNLQEVQILSEEEALRNLRIQLAALDIPRESMAALFRLLQAGLKPNLEFDAERTRLRIEQLEGSLEPVRIDVAQGQTLVEPGSRVTALQFEQLEAYRRALREAQAKEFGFTAFFYEQALLGLFVVISAVLFLRSSRQQIRRKPRTLMLSGTILLMNLLLMRLVLEMGDSALGEGNPVLLQLIPYLAPLLPGPVIITILVGTGPGILAAGLIAAFHAMMHGNSLALLFAAVMANLVAILACRNILFRAALVRAGFRSGMAMAAAALLLGIRDNLEVLTIFYQMLTAVGTGLIAGMLIVGLLPVLEHIFKYTTDITLLELTDFNHRLLRKMQIEAPGSYHHSLMVANLAENAAAAIGANPLVCRVCSLFHDVGKMIKPEYFAENQRSGINPHIERNPSMSALVIKSHVKEGVQLAREHRLPKIVVDVIQQHHGTSLIQYFYYKALELQKSEGVIESAFPNAPRIELDKVNEATYRYEGPVPQFVESAIIMLADGVEAACRSLKKVTPQSVEELIDKILLDRLQDGQLDDSPLTFAQLKKVKESFVFSILNMLHSRVEYPAGDGDDPVARRKAARKVRRLTDPPFPSEESRGEEAPRTGE